jgi:AraC family transcriptional regulator
MARRFDPVHLGSPRFETHEYGPFLVTHAWFPPGLTLPAHVHERAVVAVTLEGGWSSEIVRHPCQCTPATLLVEPAGEPHSNHFGTRGGRVMILQPDFTAREELEPARGAVRRPIAFGSGRALEIGLRMHAEIAAPDSLTQLALEALCVDLLVTAGRDLPRDRGGPPRWLRRVIEYIHVHAREPLTLDSLAGIAGVHVAHLTREFRVHRRTSIAAYVRSLRLAWAAEQLLDRQRRIADIAIDAGFADQSHFTRAFHAQTGRTPRRYRESLTV